ncbi:hypothetical protein ACWD4G_25105 [Streptomyces sp. NPDC002643]
MNETQIQALIGTLVVLGMFALVILPAAIGVVRDRRIDRQLREAELRAAAGDTVRHQDIRRHRATRPQAESRPASSHHIARAA